MSARKSWFRSDLDTNHTWPLFVLYRDLPPSQRSIAETARRSGENAAWLARVARDAVWKARAVDYDRYRDKRLCHLRLADDRQMMKRHSDIVRGALEVVAIEVGKVLEQARSPDRSSTIRVRDLVRLGEWAMKYERLTHGEATENVREVVDLSAMTDDELKDLKRLQAKASK
jgi:hypothetical protein